MANDIRKEAQEEMEKTAMENTSLKEKLNQLQAELEKTAASSTKGGGEWEARGSVCIWEKKSHLHSYLRWTWFSV